MIFAAIGIGAGSFSARMFGVGKTLKASQFAGQIFTLSFFFGFAMIITILIFHDVVLRHFGANAEIMTLCRDYLVIIVFSSPFLFDDVQR